MTAVDLLQSPVPLDSLVHTLWSDASLRHQVMVHIGGTSCSSERNKERDFNLITQPAGSSAHEVMSMHDSSAKVRMAVKQ